MKDYMRAINLELENFSESFFTKKFLERLIKLNSIHTNKIDSEYQSKLILNSAYRFMILSNFHDSRLLNLVFTEKYGKKSMEIDIHFADSLGIYKYGNKYRLTFIEVSDFTSDFNSEEYNNNIYILDTVINGKEKVNAMFNIEFFRGNESVKGNLEVASQSILITPIL